MESEQKSDLLLYGGIALILFLIVYPHLKKKGGSSKFSPFAPPKSVTGVSNSEKKQNASIALDAVRMAMKNGESQQGMNDLRDSIQKEYGLRILQRQDTKAFYVVDKDGNIVLTT